MNEKSVGGEGMNNIIKERFLKWLMWIIPILCTGLQGAAFWTAWQMCGCYYDIQKYNQRKNPHTKDSKYAEINKYENLSSKDKEVLRYDTQAIKIKEGVYVTWYI